MRAASSVPIAARQGTETSDVAWAELMVNWGFRAIPITPAHCCPIPFFHEKSQKSVKCGQLCCALTSVGCPTYVVFCS